MAGGEDNGSGLKCITLQGGTATYVESGKGITIIAVHGIPGNYLLWRAMEQELAAEFRVRRGTLPGLVGTRCMVLTEFRKISGRREVLSHGAFLGRSCLYPSSSAAGKHIGIGAFCDGGAKSSSRLEDISAAKHCVQTAEDSWHDDGDAWCDLQDLSQNRSARIYALPGIGIFHSLCWAS